MPSSATRTLQTADERREAVLEAAVHHFAAKGYYGTPTTEIASSAGISQAYLFRLFPTKQELFVAVVERCHDRVAEEFRRAAAPHAGDPQAMRMAMGMRYTELAGDRDMLLVQLHGYAAASDPVVREAVRAGYGRLVEMVRTTTGATDEELRSFFATGLMITVAAALEMHDVTLPWAQALAGPPAADC